MRPRRAARRYLRTRGFALRRNANAVAVICCYLTTQRPQLGRGITAPPSCACHLTQLHVHMPMPKPNTKWPYGMCSWRQRATAQSTTCTCQYQMTYGMCNCPIDAPKADQVECTSHAHVATFFGRCIFYLTAAATATTSGTSWNLCALHKLYLFVE